MGFKTEWLLETLIKAYLESRTPIGSESLRMIIQEAHTFGISSATIRNHFKRLTHEGALSQNHSSSGRVPTNQALKDYWRAKLNPHECLEVDLQRLQEASMHYGIFSVVETYQKAHLQSVHNYAHRWLILDFGALQIALDYHRKLEAFTATLVGLECQAIHQIALSVCAMRLAAQIESFYQKRFYFGLGFLAQLGACGHEALLLDILEGHIFRYLKEGLYFESLLPLGFLGVLQPIKTQGEETKMLCVGSLEQNFESFYHAIAQAS
ncbi:HrcA family transcriptional regulator [Helicobacter baculiformis]|uniref:HrcA family transcriptional regulator n=1 Tax=Helicobacter baculiformis TaxID=427351 RepID=A0ABV7ZI50_9HELI|nr:HrcA family transcriptional regulator [Helicobacter baculiformis]